MSDMTVLDYAMMVEDTHVNTRVIEYRIREEGDGIAERPAGRLVAAALTDIDGRRPVDGLFLLRSDARSTGRSAPS